MEESILYELFDDTFSTTECQHFHQKLKLSSNAFRHINEQFVQSRFNEEQQRSRVPASKQEIELDTKKEYAYDKNLAK